MSRSNSIVSTCAHRGTGRQVSRQFSFYEDSQDEEDIGNKEEVFDDHLQQSQLLTFFHLSSPLPLSLPEFTDIDIKMLMNILLYTPVLVLFASARAMQRPSTYGLSGSVNS
ncbi:hypothetical protein ElyMa_000000400 [Elysia marginata]|uniref:Uncharacterized protein n=1 Tax=Elysia marginata TaxID=1093978 RepID=A0AAV4E827_9GAST|nr:hypothetical protein ElyMa_000000400 [Elysia marginata]